MAAPTHNEVEKVLLDLVHDNITRSDASKWACALLAGETEPPAWDAPIEDALSALAVADGLQEPSGWLYGPGDFSEWLAEFRRRVGSN